MKHYEYFINVADSTDRCPCAKCSRLPLVAKRQDGKWVVFCGHCDLDNGLSGLNPNWYVNTKDEALYIWGGRQLVHDLFCKYRQQEVVNDCTEPMLG